MHSVIIFNRFLGYYINCLLPTGLFGVLMTDSWFWSVIIAKIYNNNINSFQCVFRLHNDIETEKQRWSPQWAIRTRAECFPWPYWRQRQDNMIKWHFTLVKRWLPEPVNWCKCHRLRLTGWPRHTSIWWISCKTVGKRLTGDLGSKKVATVTKHCS